MPPKRKKTAAKDKKAALSLKKTKGKKIQATSKHSESENVTQEQSM